MELITWNASLLLAHLLPGIHCFGLFCGFNRKRRNLNFSTFQSQLRISFKKKNISILQFRCYSNHSVNISLFFKIVRTLFFIRICERNELTSYSAYNFKLVTRERLSDLKLAYISNKSPKLKFDLTWLRWLDQDQKTIVEAPLNLLQHLKTIHLNRVCQLLINDKVKELRKQTRNAMHDSCF